MVSIYDYLDYRKYLADYYRFRKSVNKHFSYRLIADKAGIPSTGYFHELVNGTRNLTQARIPKLAKALNLSEQEQAFLSLLTDFTHAETDEAKQYVYKSLVGAMPSEARRLKRSQMEYFSKWYYVAVREALAIWKVRDNYGELAAHLRPALTAEQVKASLQLLHGLDLAAVDKDGYWKATHASVLSSKDEASGLIVQSFQAEMGSQALEALKSVPSQERVFTTVTLSVSAQGLERVKGVLTESRKRIREIVVADKNEDRVMQLNIQVFPLTQAHA